MENKKKLYIKTYGCQMNTYDSLRMQNLMSLHNYNNSNSIENSDLIILNTCHIREKATEKLYSEIGRIVSNFKKKKIRLPLITVAGCVSQAEGEEIFSRAPAVSIIVGPQSYHKLPFLVKNAEKGGKKLIELDFIDETKFENLPEENLQKGASSFISVQEGCDKFCHFCVVPYTRGKEFSRSVEEVYRETLQNISNGSKEIVLLGQNISNYHGKENGKEKSLAELITTLAKIKKLERIRYTTSHPIDMTDNLLKLHGTEEKLMPFLHLPFQSGSNKILKLMNRKYSREQYTDIIKKLRKYRPDIAISSDIIVGYPGETCEDFEDTLDLVDKVSFAQCYSFKYSPRPGTPGSLKIQIPEEEKNKRLKILQQKIFEQQKTFNKQFIGKKLSVLFEKNGKLEDQQMGKSQYFQSVYINTKRNLERKIINVEITSANQNSLTGKLSE